MYVEIDLDQKEGARARGSDEGYILGLCMLIDVEDGGKPGTKKLRPYRSSIEHRKVLLLKECQLIG